MRCLFGFICVLALGVMGCGEDGGGGQADACADWAGDWAVSSISCDGVVQSGFDSGIELRFAANCTGETVLMMSATCEEIIQMTFTPGDGDTTSVDYGANTCSAECASHECEMIADAAQPYAATVTISGDTLTMTALATAQLVSDGFTPCEVGQTMVVVAVPK
jgi:hypothetical protein